MVSMLARSWCEVVMKLYSSCIKVGVNYHSRTFSFDLHRDIFIME